MRAYMGAGGRAGAAKSVMADVTDAVKRRKCFVFSVILFSWKKRRIFLVGKILGLFCQDFFSVCIAMSLGSSISSSLSFRKGEDRWLLVSRDGLGRTLTRRV